MDRMPRTVQKTLGGRYTLHEPLGGGRLAEVFRATDQSLGRTVAVKLLRPRFSAAADVRAHFQRSAQQAARLIHPHIVTIYDVGEDSGQVYLVMEHLPGQTLADSIPQEGPLALDEALRLAREVCAGVGHAHERGIVHGSLKPQHVLLTEDGQAKITDFGLALGTEALRGAPPGPVAGSRPYVAPEQAVGRPATAQSDVYALGVILYELLTGSPPRRGRSSERDGQDAPLAIRDLPLAVPPPVREVVWRALAHNPDARYANAAEMAQALSEDVLARGPARSRVRRSPPSGRRQTAVRVEPSPPFVTPLAPVPSVGSTGSGAGGALVLAGLFLILLVVFAGGGMVLARSVAPSLLRPPPVLPTPALSPVPTAVPTPQPTATVAPSPTTASGPLIPQLVQVPREQAEQWLQSLGLRYEIAEEYSDVVEEGDVLSQYPVALQSLPAGETVKLVVSRGPRLRPVPAVVGTPADAAKKHLEEAGFTVKTQEAYSDTVPEGAVIAQEPGAEERVEAETTVRLVISQGSQPVIVPNLVGRDLRTAREILGRLGMGAVVIEQTDSKAPPGTVIAQIPAGGLPAPKGSTVRLAVQAS